jgi:hypothetical protein
MMCGQVCVDDSSCVGDCSKCNYGNGSSPYPRCGRK